MIPIIGQKNPGESLQEMQIRLLVCTTCAKIEELPDFEGDPSRDVLLQVSVEKHRFPDGTEHVGNLMKVPLKFWANPKVKDEILRQIRHGAGGMNDLQEGFYDTKSTFQEDALKCYSQHLRPKGSCPDYKSEAKRLKPAISKSERREAGLPSESAGPKVYLCDFCPVKSFMMTKSRQQRGMYR